MPGGQPAAPPALTGYGAPHERTCTREALLLARPAARPYHGGTASVGFVGVRSRN